MTSYVKTRKSFPLVSGRAFGHVDKVATVRGSLTEVGENIGILAAWLSSVSFGL